MTLEPNRRMLEREPGLSVKRIDIALFMIVRRYQYPPKKGPCDSYGKAIGIGNRISRTPTAGCCCGLSGIGVKGAVTLSIGAFWSSLLVTSDSILGKMAKGCHITVV